MAVRVRKLARELQRSPTELLVLLKDLGFDKFRSEDDMVSEPIAERVRKAGRSAGPPRSPPPTAPPKPATRAAEPADLMSKLVPGVVRTGGEARVLPKPPVRVAPAAGDADAQEVVDRVQAARVALETERRALEAQRAELDAERRSFAAQRAAVEVERARLEGVGQDLAREREALERDRLSLERVRSDPEGSVLALLEERGLRGVDEAERAVGALCQARVFGRFLATLRPTDPAALQRLFADRLLLVSGPVPDGLGLPSVTVSDDRADLPAAERLTRSLTRLGERLLLDGRRRVLFAGIAPRWHGLIREGLDRRVEVEFRPTAARDGASAADEVERADLVVLWNLEVLPTAAEVYAASRTRVVEVRATSLADWLDRLLVALSEG